ncbi:hypothetical protein DdX_14356 [Ditylenchus destructor]|uniref:Uncharacterized protein n=1 Tax=Ditylenchus destructor TaxID=166010 RepID=A0AAD4MX46_9BILA|nr:hypothetical protein DdX_14356 [Ditylenchus destructor]
MYEEKWAPFPLALGQDQKSADSRVKAQEELITAVKWVCPTLEAIPKGIPCILKGNAPTRLSTLSAVFVFRYVCVRPTSVPNWAEPSAFVSAHPRPKSIDFNPGSNDPENCTKFDSNSGRNYSVTAKFLTFQTFLNSNALRLFQPAMAEITVDPENVTQNPETEVACLELDLELRYRSALYFVPKPIMGTEIELDYDAEDGSRLLAKRRLRARRNMSRREVEFDCSLFVRPGFYRLTVKGENEKSSDWIQIPEPNTAEDTLPHLQLRNDSIFPHCTNDLAITWSLPNCSSHLFQVLDFRIRALALSPPSQASTSDTWPLREEWIHMEEFPISTQSDGKSSENEASGTLTIPCAQFDIIHEKFCFELISTERKTRHFESWDRKCVSTEPDHQRGFEPSQWTEWSVWSPCVQRPNFDQGFGYRKRRRHCIRTDDTRNKVVQLRRKGNFCSGPALMKENYSFPTPMQLIFPTSDLINNTNVTQNGSSDHRIPGCDCGCDLTPENVESEKFSELRRTFFAGSSKCSVETKHIWTLRPNQRKDLRLELEVYSNFENLEYKWDNLFRVFRIYRNSQSTQIQPPLLLLAGGTRHQFPLSKELLWVNDNRQFEDKYFYSRKDNESFKVVLEPDVWQDVTFQFTFEATTRYRLFGRKSSPTSFVPGFFVNYRLSPVTPPHDSSPPVLDMALRYAVYVGRAFFDCSALVGNSRVKCERIVAIITAIFCLLLAVAALVVPPIVFTFITRRYTSHRILRDQKTLRNNGGANSDSEALISSYSQRSDMQRSGDTDCTHLTSSQCPNKTTHSDGCKTKVQSMATSANRSNNQVSHRSIGIQLSRQSTPRSASRCLVSHSGGRTRRSTTASLTNSATGGEEEELEYDYYEYKHLGKEESSETGQVSGMMEEFEFVSHIDIDQIVRKETSGWLEGLANGEKSLNGQNKPVAERQDAHTQI